LLKIVVGRGNRPTKSIDPNITNCFMVGEQRIRLGLRPFGDLNPRLPKEFLPEK